MGRLHPRSCEKEADDRLLLLGKGPDGTAARTIRAEEARLLLHGRYGFHPDSSIRVGNEDPARALLAAPRTLASLATQWVAAQLELQNPGPGLGRKAGLCQLPWEDETERVLLDWLRDHPAEFSQRVGANRGEKTREHPKEVGRAEMGKGKGKKEDPHTRASKALSRVLRHEAGTEECPISEEGWVRWSDLAHPAVPTASCKTR